MKYEPTIGLEVHIELNTGSKMFCSCLNDSEAKEPNINICPICTGHPGTLPVINKLAIEKIIKTGLSLNCTIPEYSNFDRKNYFYPDLPKGYQISQNENPFCLKGFLEIDDKKIGITRIHLEEDAGKLIHPEGTNYSLVDFNRAGVALMELVTDPDIKSAQEARKFIEELRMIMRYLGVSNADMEKGELRVDANISLALPGEELGTRAEIKNLNSFRSVERAIKYEIKRQAEILEKGEKIIQQTRGWDEGNQITTPQREKEASHDYRYFPEPDLPVIHIKKPFIDLEMIESSIPELPSQRRERFEAEYNLTDREIEYLLFDKDLGNYYEKVTSELLNWMKEADLKDDSEKKEELKLYRIAANYLLTDLQGLLNGMSVANDEFIINPENFAEFICLIYKGDISSNIAKKVIKEMFESGGDPSNIINEKGLTELRDESEIESIIHEVIASNTKAVEDYKNGKEASFKFLVGQVMSKSKGRANPQAVDKILKKLI